MSLQISGDQPVKRKRGRPKGSGDRRGALTALLRQHDFCPVAELVDLYRKPELPDTERVRILLGFLPYTHQKLPQEQVVSNPQSLSLTINLGDSDKQVKTIEHEDE